LLTLSHTIHAHPELCFEEERSARWVAEALAAGGFDVEAGVCDLPTAFVATAGNGPLTVAICAEYDALPGIGHACGHNVIAAAAAGAGLALAPLAGDLGLTVKVMGTPAEEGGGGKILMLERGAFAGVNAAMMVHPAPGEQDRIHCLAVAHFDVNYKGKAAHASAYPEEGINAGDAVTVAQVAIGLLRQHLRRGDQVHGIVSDGGDAPNVVPAHASAHYLVRSPTLASLAEAEPRVRRCFEAGALATGATMEIVPRSPDYSELLTDEGIAAAWRANAEALGRRSPPPSEQMTGGSTDMANLSLAMPVIHPMLGIDSLPAVNHQPEFAAACVTPAADRAVHDGAVGMAWTAIDLATDPELRARLVSSRCPRSGPVPGDPANPRASK
ncbi:MAG: M20 family metallopeptidase, partial [Acidimicrobiales bacterium]